MTKDPATAVIVMSCMVFIMGLALSKRIGRSPFDRQDDQDDADRERNDAENAAR